MSGVGGVVWCGWVVWVGCRGLVIVRGGRLGLCEEEVVEENCEVGGDGG